MAVGQVAILLIVIFAVLLAPMVVVYLATGGSAIAMNQLGHLYMELALPIGIAAGVIVLVMATVVSMVRRGRTGPRV